MKCTKAIDTARRQMKRMFHVENDKDYFIILLLMLKYIFTA